MHWLWRDFPGPVQVAANTTMLQRFAGLNDLNDAYWTLQVELAFYGVCYGLWSAGMLGNARLLAAIALVSGVYWYLLLGSGLGLFRAFLPARAPLPGYYLEWFSYLSIMTMGAALRRHAQGDRRGLVLTALAAVLWLVVQPLTGLYLHRPGASPQLLEFVDLKYGAYAIGLWLFFVLGFVVKIRHPAAAWLGRISYSLYLQHLPIIYLLAWICTRLGWTAPLSGLGWVLVLTLATTAVSAALYRWVEAPGIALSDRITRRIRERSGAAAHPIQGADQG
jgi:peptidoglycan/LPS O-acetylase OafA/YrhL